MKIKLFFLFIALFGSTAVEAQNIADREEISWFSSTQKFLLSEKVFAKNEFHFRRINFLDYWQQIMIRPQLHYVFSETVSVGAGSSHFIHYPYERAGINRPGFENNIWEQLLIGSKAGRMSFSNRLRLEHRFFQTPQLKPGIAEPVIENTFHNRLRNRLTLKVPLRIKEGQTTSIFLYDEFFLVLFDRNLLPNHFQQNWINLGISQALSNQVNFNAGFIHQWINNGTGFSSFSGITAGINFIFDLKKKKD